MRPTPGPLVKSEPPSLWLSSGSPVSINEGPYQRVCNVAERLQYGWRKEAFHWKKRKTSFLLDWQFSRPSHLARKALWLPFRMEVPPHRWDWNPRYSTTDQARKPSRLDGPQTENRPSLKFWLGSCPVFWSVPLQRIGPLTKTSWRIPIIAGTSSRLDSFFKTAIPNCSIQRLWWTGFGPTSTRLIGSWNHNASMIHSLF